MTISDDRLKAFEAKYANDKAVAFKITSKRNKKLGLWAAEILGAADPEAYAREVIASDFIEAGDEDIIGKVEGDLDEAGKAQTPDMVRNKLAEFEAEAKSEVAEELEHRS